MMKEKRFLPGLRRIVSAAALVLSMPLMSQTTVLTEDFSGSTNIFGVTSTTATAGTAYLNATGLSGFDNVLAVCNATATGTFDSTPLSVSGGSQTVEWDAFHGYFASAQSTTVSLLNSDGNELASYTYASNTCKITAVNIGGSAASGFAEFSLQSLSSSRNANGFGGNGRPYVATSGYNPHITVTITSQGGVTMTFALNGTETSFTGTIGSLTNNLSQMKVASTVSNTDRCYAIDNITITQDATNYYNVTFDVQGTQTTEVVEENGKVESAPSTEIGGYIFKGWTTDGSTDYDASKTYLTTDEVLSAAVTANITYTAVFVEDPDYVEPIASIVINGAETMTFGSDTDTPYNNAYTLTITGADGTVITEDNISSKVSDFNVVWDIAGFKTENDTEGQYCDSYGSFSANNTGSVSTTFDLKDVPMNFYGKMTATVTYNGTTTVAEKYVVALGDLTVKDGQILPVAGYPILLTEYDDALAGYEMTHSTYGTGSDLILGGWCRAGSDGDATATLTNEDGLMFVRLTAANLKKSHVFTHSVSFDTQVMLEASVRFNSAGGLVTFTSGYPFWSSKNYTCPVTLNFDGTNITLNGTALTKDGSAATFSTGTWYAFALSVDKTSEKCYAKIYDAESEALIGETEVLAWAETSTPTFLSFGMGNSNTGSIDIAGYSLEKVSTADSLMTLSADKETLSIPNGDTARVVLTAYSNDCDNYFKLPVTITPEWSIVEEDMKEGIEIVPDADDSYTVTVKLLDGAQAGTATLQASINGVVQTITLSITSSEESIKFTESTASITIPSDDTPATATYKAILVDGEGNDTGSTVTLALYDKDGAEAYTPGDGITFDATTGELTVTSAASPATFTVKATGTNSNGETISRSVKVIVHGLKFDFGMTTDEAIAEGYTVVGTSTSYSATAGYGIASGTVAEGGEASATDATTDWLEGAMEFDAKVTKGSFYTVTVTYQGTLSTGYVNSDLSGYTLGTQTSMTTETFTIPATTDVMDIHVSNYATTDATTVARIAKIEIEKQPARSERSKIVVHDIGDSTSANNGSWAYRLKNVISSEYPELDALCTFHNDGAGGRNLSTYYTQGKYASVLNDIYPGDIVMIGNMGTNGMGSSFEDDLNYYIDAAEALGAKVILNSYTPHGAVGSYTSGYDSSTNTFTSYRTDSYDNVVRSVASSRSSDENYLGFVEIGKNADVIFNAYVADYASNGYESADAAAQAIIACFTDHNHYSNGTLACDLMLGGYETTDTKGIVAQLVDLLNIATGISEVKSEKVFGTEGIYTISGQKLNEITTSGIYIINGRKVSVKK